MVIGHPKTVHPSGPEKEREPAASHGGEGKDGACRCKEASEMTPRELLKLMFSDLTFWKKEKKG